MESVVIGAEAAGLEPRARLATAPTASTSSTTPASRPMPPRPYARALAQVVTETKPAVVLIPFTAMGKDLAPRVAARTGAGLVLGLRGAGGRRTAGVEARRPDVRGQGLRDRPLGRRAADGHAPGERLPAGAARSGAQGRASSRARVDVASRARVTATRATAAGKVELTEAQIIVSGGRGLKGPEHFHLVQELGEAFGAAVGASRAVVDAGWVDHQMQVGQTGKTVSPTPLHRLRHQRSDPAPGRDVVVEGHRRDQQGRATRRSSRWPTTGSSATPSRSCRS